MTPRMESAEEMAANLTASNSAGDAILAGIANDFDHRDYKRIEAAPDAESRDKLNKSNGGPGI